MWTDVLVELPRRLQGLAQLSGAIVALDQEMEIMAVVHQGIDASLHIIGLEILAIGLGCRFIGSCSRIIVACADVDMSRHVDEMARAWVQSRQSLRARQRPLGLEGCLYRMNIEMVCPDVLGIPSEH